jgi:hypothetical protein
MLLTTRRQFGAPQLHFMPQKNVTHPGGTVIE